MLGKRVRNALYVHREAAGLLPADLQERLRRALDLAEPVDWNVARLEPTVIGLLRYANFEEDPFPALRASVRVDLTIGAVAVRDFSRAQNPLILHRKEQLVAADHPGAAEWARLTEALVARGLFREPHLIGRRNSWRRRLAAAGVRLEGHQLCPA